ncbi:AsnC family transcriptional regulator, partial [Candidatus Woesearchaeota archaeon]|nr:AsnC family transcriptional regulator [Candidatus Woesearchaeota archaeon]
MGELCFRRVDESVVRRPKIDLRDKKILAMLSGDSRMPLSAIAKRTRVSRDTVDYRIQRMAKNGIILGFVVNVNLGFFGYSSYHVFMVVNTLDEKRKGELVAALVRHPNTRSVMEYHDTWDLEWVIVARGLREFDSILTGITDEFRDIVVRKDKLAIIRGFKSIQLPGALYRESMYPPMAQGVKRRLDADVDGKDVLLLQELSIDCRRSSYDLGRKLGISPDTVTYRIKRLVLGGVIFGFTVIPSLTALDYHLYTFCVNVKTFNLGNEMRFREFAASNANILRAVKVLGDWDLLIYVTTQSPESFHFTFKEAQH